MKIYNFLIFVLLFSFSSYSQNHGHSHDKNDSHKEESHEGHGHEEEKESHNGHGREEESHGDHEEGEEKGHDDHAEHKGHEGHEGHEGHGSSKAIGEGKAIEEVDEEKGFEMSDEAKNTIGVKLKDFTQSPIIIPKEALVVSLDKRGIYRFRHNFFKMIPAKIEDETQSTFTVAVNDIKEGDQIAVGGVGLLRVTDIYSTDTSEYGHAH